MANYFKDFQKIQYNLDGVTRTNVINILNRFDVLSRVLERTELFYDYIIRGNETPEMVAEKFYGDMKYHYIITFFNKILDPYYDWPMADNVFEKYMEENFGTENYTKQTVKYYYHVIQHKSIGIDGKEIPEQKNIIQYDDYLKLDSFERDYITIYDYEAERNEKKRFIKILDSIYLKQIEEEKARIFNE